MECERIDNKNLNDNKLSLDSMNKLSIDEIISLYGQGYRLEGTENEIVFQSISNIESMQTYGQTCSGDPTPDINWSSVSQQGGSYLYKESAKAFKINPTSRCLDFITFYAIRRIADVNIYVEIRHDDGTGNKPLGTPGSSTGQVAEVLVTYGNIPTSFGIFNVDFGLVLPSIGTYWIVLRSADHFCSTTATPRLELSRHSPGSRYMVYGYSELYCAPIGCCWYFLDTDTIPIATYKKTYSPPVLDTISIAPTSASINVGATQPLTFACKDQYNNTITCPTLAWSSSNTSVATVNISSGLVTSVAVGSTNITASGGNKTSNQSVITVVPAVTCQSISNVNANPSILTLGGTVSLIATVTPSMTTTQEFNVDFKDGTTILNITPITTVNRIATFDWTPATSKTYNIKAHSGTCVSPTATSVTVNPVPSCTSLSLTVPSIGARGGSITLSATMSPVASGVGVVFKDGTTILATRSTGGTGKATYIWSIPTNATLGDHTISASIPGTSCTDSKVVSIIEAQAAAAGGAIVIAAVALAAVVMFMARKPPTVPK